MSSFECLLGLGTEMKCGTCRVLHLFTWQTGELGNLAWFTRVSSNCLGHVNQLLYLRALC